MGGFPTQPDVSLSPRNLLIEINGQRNNLASATAHTESSSSRLKSSSSEAKHDLLDETITEANNFEFSLFGEESYNCQRLNDTSASAVFIPAGGDQPFSLRLDLELSVAESQANNIEFSISGQGTTNDPDFLSSLPQGSTASSRDLVIEVDGQRNNFELTFFGEESFNCQSLSDTSASAAGIPAAENLSFSLNLNLNVTEGQENNIEFSVSGQGTANNPGFLSSLPQAEITSSPAPTPSPNGPMVPSGQVNPQQLTIKTREVEILLEAGRQLANAEDNKNKASAIKIEAENSWDIAKLSGCTDLTCPNGCQAEGAYCEDTSGEWECMSETHLGEVENSYDNVASTYDTVAMGVQNSQDTSIFESAKADEIITLGTTDQEHYLRVQILDRARNRLNTECDGIRDEMEILNQFYNDIATPVFLGVYHRDEVCTGKWSNCGDDDIDCGCDDGSDSCESNGHGGWGPDDIRELWEMRKDAYNMAVNSFWSRLGMSGWWNNNPTKSEEVEQCIDNYKENLPSSASEICVKNLHKKGDWDLCLSPAVQDACEDFLTTDNNEYAEYSVAEQDYQTALTNYQAAVSASANMLAQAESIPLRPYGSARLLEDKDKSVATQDSFKFVPVPDQHVSLAPAQPGNVLLQDLLSQGAHSGNLDLCTFTLNLEFLPDEKNTATTTTPHFLLLGLLMAKPLFPLVCLAGEVASNSVNHIARGANSIAGFMSSTLWGTHRKPVIAAQSEQPHNNESPQNPEDSNNDLAEAQNNLEDFDNDLAVLMTRLRLASNKGLIAKNLKEIAEWNMETAEGNMKIAQGKEKSMSPQENLKEAQESAEASLEYLEECGSVIKEMLTFPSLLASQRVNAAFIKLMQAQIKFAKAQVTLAQELLTPERNTLIPKAKMGLKLANTQLAVMKAGFKSATEQRDIADEALGMAEFGGDESTLPSECMQVETSTTTHRRESFFSGEKVNRAASFIKSGLSFWGTTRTKDSDAPENQGERKYGPTLRALR